MGDTKVSTPALLRAARHLLSLSQVQVAEATGLSLSTIKRAESERDVPVSADAVAAIRAALEAAGVEFIAENGGGPGVRLRVDMRAEFQFEQRDARTRLLASRREGEGG